MAVSLAVEKKKLKNPPLQLHYLGDRVLRQPAKRVSKVDDSTRDIVRKMLQTMYSADGIGLAAPQVGINKQILVIDIHPDDPKAEPLVMINPVIKDFSEELEVCQEGCLSIPGVYLEVRRPAMVEVSYKDEWGRPQVIMAGGLLARAIQHEIDHLTGVMFVDRVENQALLHHELKEHGFTASAVRPIAA
ncbi:MAG: peptide deformylase [Thermosynechococcus sp.]|uniref:peptide deformylase n=1 Tax=Thermosynechococcus sp. TaxID=2814275 RepID=UPI0022069627|nr:peptide deformylase [Thermosynechococcus sp.]BCX13384.1 MAG: peptide deformylase [Thermosynechococcus sp.]